MKPIQAEVIAANREGREVSLSDEQLTQLGHHKRPLTKVIRAFCLRCMGGDRAQVRKCTAVRSELYPYRLGTNPFSDRKGNPSSLQPSARSPFQDQRGVPTPKTPRPTKGAA